MDKVCGTLIDESTVALEDELNDDNACRARFAGRWVRILRRRFNWILGGS
jgi:hypothetical protein